MRWPKPASRWPVDGFDPMSDTFHRCRPALLLALAVLGLGACSRDEGLRCESPERYGSATSIPPLRVPEDLSVPDETEVLRIPDERSAQSPADPVDCLEAPPEFSEANTPGAG